MSTDYKYFIITKKPKYASRGIFCIVQRWDPYIEVSLDEDVEHQPYLSIEIDKLQNVKSPFPTSDVYCKVKPILPELFQDYYSLFLRTMIDTTLIIDDEYYEQDHHGDYYEIQYFAGEGRMHRKININFSNDVKNFSITLSRSGSYADRRGWRKNGKLIDKAKFLQYFNLSLQFLADPASYLVFLEDFILNFRKLIKGDTSITGFIKSPEQTLLKIIEQLEGRKHFIEDRLIKNDSDSKLTRSQLRGELDGIFYAIKTIKESLT